MNRLQKKCLVLSAALHLLLLAVLVVGPAFLPSRPTPINDLPILDVIPAKLVDDLVSGGGARGAPPPGPKIRTAELPRSAPPPRAAVKRPNEPILPEPSPNPSDEIPPEPPKARPTRRHEIEPNLKPVFRSSERRSSTPRRRAEEAAREEADAAAAARQREFGNVIGAIRGGLSGNTDIEPVEGGEGGTGGEAYGNYAQAIKSIYDHAWYDPPQDVTDESLNVLVKIVIRRDGKVISARIEVPSKNTALDQSVRRALDRVKEVPHFPAGAKDEERSYTINFNLRAKRLTG